MSLHIEKTNNPETEQTSLRQMLGSIQDLEKRITHNLISHDRDNQSGLTKKTYEFHLDGYDSSPLPNNIVRLVVYENQPGGRWDKPSTTYFILRREEVYRSNSAGEDEKLLVTSRFKITVIPRFLRKEKIVVEEADQDITNKTKQFQWITSHTRGRQLQSQTGQKVATTAEDYETYQQISTPPEQQKFLNELLHF